MKSKENVVSKKVEYDNAMNRFMIKNLMHCCDNPRQEVKINSKIMHL